MRNYFYGAVLSAVLAVTPSIAAAGAPGELSLSIANGRVTLVAQNVPLRQVLEEWARLGHTTIVNGDKLNGPPITLQLVDRPEREVLDVLLRSASGYIAAPRTVAIANSSQFERVMILPVSRGPVGVAAAPPQPFGRANGGGPPMQMPPPVEDDDEPMDPPTGQPMVVQQPQPQPAPPYPGMPPQQQPTVTPQGLQPPGGQPPQQQVPMTSPRPGMLPAPPATGQPGQQPQNRPPGDPD
jgi:hypothetical protein